MLDVPVCLCIYMSYQPDKSMASSAMGACMTPVHVTAGQPPLLLPEAWKQFKNALSRHAESDLHAILTITRFPNRGSEAEYTFNIGLAEALVAV